MSNPNPPTNRPVWAFASLVVFVGSLTLLYATGKDSGAGLLIAVAVGNLPTLVAAVASEQAARDIRNGTVSRKAKEGALEAIDESGVLTRTGPVAVASLAASAAQLEALNTTLARLHTLTEQTAAKVDRTAAKVDQTTAAVDSLVDGGSESV
jgi:hypothetical protein